MEKVCKHCGKVFKTDQRKQKNCNQVCYGAFLRENGTGKNHSCWKGGRVIDERGYVLIHSPNYTNQVHKYVPEHRLVMEKHLGRFLTSDEVVHHRNGDKVDNRIQNLEIMTRREHRKFHAKNPIL